MADLQGLSDEINNDPLSRGYSTMTDQEVVEDLNTKYRKYFVPVNSRELLVWAGQNNRLRDLDAARNDSNFSDSVRNISEIAIRLVQRDDAAYNPNDSRHEGMIDSLISAGVFSSSDKSDLHALGERHRTRVEELGIINPTAHQVSLVRGD